MFTRLRPQERWPRQSRRPCRLLGVAGRFVASMVLAGLVWGCDGATSEGDVGPNAELAPIPTEEYRARRTRLLESHQDGILLIHARTGPKAMTEWGFLQDPTFQYLTGLPELPAAILALDGPARMTHLFLPPPPEPFGGPPVEEAVPPPGASTAARLEIDSVRPWGDFAGWVADRLDQGVDTLYIEGPERPEATGAPPGLPPVAGQRRMWREALSKAFPGALLQNARPSIMALRAVKSDAEIARLALNARRTAFALRSVAARLAPGVTERTLQAAAVAACIESGAQGPSFWPWIMSGPDAHILPVLGSVLLYDQGDRSVRAGELVRVDLGCAGEFYGGDVGRTLPVSGRFDPGQAEAWDLLIAGYRAGLDAMADGVPVVGVRAASAAEIQRRSGSLQTEKGRAAAEAILADRDFVWHIHGVGIDSGEEIPDTLKAGMVVAYEPGFSVGGDAFYLEDMILVTGDGHRILSEGLPYSADEIARLMR